MSSRISPKYVLKILAGLLPKDHPQYATHYEYYSCCTVDPLRLTGRWRIDTTIKGTSEGSETTQALMIEVFYTPRGDNPPVKAFPVECMWVDDTRPIKRMWVHSSDINECEQRISNEGDIQGCATKGRLE